MLTFKALVLLPKHLLKTLDSLMQQLELGNEAKTLPRAPKHRCKICGDKLRTDKDLVEHYAYRHPGVSTQWLFEENPEKE